MGGAMGGMNQNGQLARMIERLKTPTARAEAEAKIAAKYKDDYAKIVKALDEADTKLAELAKKAEVELPATQEENSKKVNAFLTKEKEAIDKLLETDKTDSRSAMQSFRELAQKAGVELNAGFGGGMGGQRGQGGAAGAGAMGGQRGQGGAAGAGAMGGQRGQRGQGAAGGQGGRGNSASLLEQIKEKYPTEYAEAEKLRDTDQAAYREKLRELRAKLNAAN